MSPDLLYSTSRDVRGRDITRSPLAPVSKKNKEKKQTKKATLLSNPNVLRWYQNLLRGSINSAEHSVTKLSRFCELASYQKKVVVSPDSIIKLDQKQLDDLVQDVVDAMESGGNDTGKVYAPDYIKKVRDVLASWLRHNDREVKRDVRISNAGVAVTLEDEKSPEIHELDEVLCVATPRCKASICLMSYAGVRPGVLGNKSGDGGLQLKDLPDLDIENLRFVRYPAQVIVRREVSKIRHQYFSFLPRKGCDYLIAYLRQRRSVEGEQLSGESPVVRANFLHKKRSLHALGREPTNYFLCTENITNEVRNAIRASGYNWRPYIDRVYFATHTTTARLEGKVDPDIQQFWMGHTGPVLRAYTTNKHRLPAKLMQQVTEHYVRASAYLTGEPLEEGESIEKRIEDVRAQTRKEVEHDLGQKITDLTEKVSFLMSRLGGAEREYENYRVWIQSEDFKALEKDGLVVES